MAASRNIRGAALFYVPPPFLQIVAPKPPVICLDPGHTSEVGEGTRGKRLTELHFAWSVAVDLRAVLLREGYKVVMTKRSEREKVTNRRRAEIANAANASLMLRLHCDSAMNSGSTIYYPTHPGRAKDGTRGPSAEVLRRTAVTAKAFAAGYREAIRGQLPYDGLFSDDRTAIGSKQGALTGSIFSKVPAVLVEMVVLTNPRDEAFAESASGRRAIVHALARGVESAVPIQTR